MSLISMALIAGLVLALSAAAGNYRADRRPLVYELAIAVGVALLAGVATALLRTWMGASSPEGPLTAAAVLAVCACIGRAAVRLASTATA